MKKCAVGLLGVLVACGGSDSTGPKAASVTGVFGDNGSVLTGGTLPVGFTVLGADGFPARGVRVTWAVSPTTAATVNATQTSDSAGAIATSVIVGATVGPFTVTATPNGVAPITFHLTALDPCKYSVSYALGDSVNASLSRTDCQVNAGTATYFYDFYQMTLPAGQQSIRINEASNGANKIDPYVEFYRPTGELLGWDDDIQAGVIQTSQFDVVLGDGGSYIIGATSYDPDTTGPYILTSHPRATTLSGCQDAWMTPGATIIDTIRTSDCQDSTLHYSDIIYMFMQANQVIRVAERSTVVNPLLRLYWANVAARRFDSVAANDDSATGNPNAYIAYTVPANGWYLLQMGTAAANDTGEYTLAFDANTTGPSAPRTSVRATSPLDRVMPFLPRGTFRGWKGRPLALPRRVGVR
jgi:hypothetical protein